MIEKNRSELEQFGPIHAAREMVDIGSGAKREVTAYYLNEEQAASCRHAEPRAAGQGGPRHAFVA